MHYMILHILHTFSGGANQLTANNWKVKKCRKGIIASSGLQRVDELEELKASTEVNLKNWMMS